MARTISDFNRTRWLRCFSYSAIPPFSPLQAYLSEFVDAQENVVMVQQGILTVALPSYDGQYGPINGPELIQAGGYGLCTYDSPTAVPYDQSQGTPLYGQVWVPQASSPLLGVRPFVTPGGFFVYGTVVPGILMGYRRPHAAGLVKLTSTSPASLSASAGAATFSWSCPDNVNAWGQFDPRNPTRFVTPLVVDQDLGYTPPGQLGFVTVTLTPVSVPPSPTGNLRLYFQDQSGTTFAEFGGASSANEYDFPDLNSSGGVPNPLTLMAWFVGTTYTGGNYLELVLENNSNVDFNSISASLTFGLGETPFG